MPGVDLKDLANWSLASGVENADESLRLAIQRIVDERFKSDSTTPGFTVNTTGSGGFAATIAEFFKASSPTNADQAWAVGDTAHDKTSDFKIIVQNRLKTFGAQPGIIRLNSKATQSIAGSLGTGNLLIDYRVASSTVRVLYFDSGGGIHSWNPATQAWQVSSLGFITITNLEVVIVEFIADGTRWHVVVKDPDGTELANTSDNGGTIAWANTQDNPESNLWPIIGNADVNAVGTTYYHDYISWSNDTGTDYSTTSPAATMGQIAVGQNIDQIPIDEDNETGASISWDYDIGAGFITGNTLAQLKTALVGTSPVTLDLRANLISDGVDRAGFEFNGQTIAGAGGGSPMFGGMIQ